LKYNVDPLLIYAQMNQESRFKQSAVSYKGASGLMQLMPDTARRFGVTNIFDKRQNIDAGVKYMRWLLNKFGGDVRLALAGYNAGEGAVMKYGNAIPPYRETQDYVKRITSHYSQIKNLNLNNTVAAISADQAPEIR
jgi:soluble lytic murein transglycosylase-like protein